MRSPTVPIETKICLAGNLADLITCAKFQDYIFRGYNCTRGRISHFPITFFAWALQQCSAIALPVMCSYPTVYVYLQLKMFCLTDRCTQWNCIHQFLQRSALLGAL